MGELYTVTAPNGTPRVYEVPACKQKGPLRWDTVDKVYLSAFHVAAGWKLEGKAKGKAKEAKGKATVDPE